jgi:geranylgeranyl diphosphate synthase, type I
MIASQESSGRDNRSLEGALAPYRDLVQGSLRAAMLPPGTAGATELAVETLLDEFYGQIEYHLGWRQPDLTPATEDSGKLLRPTLVLISCDLASGYAGCSPAERRDLLARIAPAAACIELVHNFSLIHDDIEDSDEERRHRPTVWKVWGVAQAINTGDGLFALARRGLWQLADRGVESRMVIRLAALLDLVCVELCEGQFLDMRYEGRRDISEEMYLDMISRKTAALMACATEFGACLGSPRDANLQEQLARFGRALGIAFQLRDDLLGIWEAERLGKTVAGDLRRKKMSLPVIHALHTGMPTDRATLRRVMRKSGPLSERDIDEALAILDRTGARRRIRSALEEQGRIARAALEESVGGAHAHAHDSSPYQALATLLDFVLATE